MVRRLIDRMLDLIADRMLEKLGPHLGHNETWLKSNYAPEGFPWNMYPFRITEACFRLASEETAEYVTENMLDAKSVTDSLTLLDTTLDKAPKEGLYLEFGVFSGTTINFIADKVETTVHGFDSFSGLPEDWLYTPKGHFDKGGTPPEVRDTVKLHVGWFDDTLPGFIKEHSGPVAFIHIDSDLYSSAKTILYSLKDQIQKGTVIQFDEYFNFPGWKSQEFKAFQEFINDTGLKYEYIGYTTSGFSASVVIC